MVLDLTADITLTVDHMTDLEDGGITCAIDLRDEAIKALREGSETAIEYATIAWLIDEDRESAAVSELMFFPNAKRGAVNVGGDSQWTDCDDLTDLVDRFQNYEERWLN